MYQLCASNSRAHIENPMYERHLEHIHQNCCTCIHIIYRSNRQLDMDVNIKAILQICKSLIAIESNRIESFIVSLTLFVYDSYESLRYINTCGRHAHSTYGLKYNQTNLTLTHSKFANNVDLHTNCNFVNCKQFYWQPQPSTPYPSARFHSHFHFHFGFSLKRRTFDELTRS